LPAIPVPKILEAHQNLQKLFKPLLFFMKFNLNPFLVFSKPPQTFEAPKNLSKILKPSKKFQKKLSNTYYSAASKKSILIIFVVFAIPYQDP
jgi:hypothetical protein